MHPVGQKLPNDLGLFDVLGNAIEWCTEAYRSKLAGPPDNPRIDAIVDAEISNQVDRDLRGGMFEIAATFLRSAERNWGRPPELSTYLGFRPARTYP
jgi:formylglycine-generating enzyme required for sulfatase activity